MNIGNSLTVKTTPSGPRIIITVGEPLEVKCEAFGDPDPEVRQTNPSKLIFDLRGWMAAWSRTGERRSSWWLQAHYHLGTVHQGMDPNRSHESSSSNFSILQSVCSTLECTLAREATPMQRLLRTSTSKVRSVFRWTKVDIWSLSVVEPSKVATISILGGSSQWFQEGKSGELTCTATGSHLIDRIEWVKVRKGRGK